MRRSSPLAFLAFLFLFLTPLAFARELNEYAVILDDPAPAQQASPGDRQAVRAAAPRIEAAQARVRQELKGRNFTVTGSARIFLNAVFVSADASNVAELRAIPGVKDVVRLKRFHRSLDRAEQLVNVPNAWNLLGGMGNAGAGVKIGIIDTGIEAAHPAFQDNSLSPPAGYPICQGGDCAYTNNKIIVARSYVSALAAGSQQNPAVDSRPDDYSPRDRVGHGTAVAMAAAGVSSAGPSDTITGVAPKAFLGVYKVFGSPGVNDYTGGGIVITALEDAFNDGMDIAVLSLGAPALSGALDAGNTCGISAGTACDPEATTVQNAVNAGMLVVVAAGNEGDAGTTQPTLNTVDSPGNAPSAIAVAATTNSHQFSNGVTVNGIGTLQGRFGNGPLPVSTLTAPLSDIEASTGDPNGCTAPAAASLTGTIVLIQRGVCTFAAKVQDAITGGALGVILTNTPGDDSLLSPGGLNGTSIPAVLVGYGAGQSIRTFLKGNPQATASIDPALHAFDIASYNQVASFSSRGPALGTNGLKPDIAAPGTDIYLAGETYDPNGALYSPSGYLVSQGTSFSTPIVAGAAALVKQRYPALNALQIKSMLVNTATQDVTDQGGTASVLAVGSGKLNAAAAVLNNLVVSPTNASFGVIASGMLPLTQALQLTNIGGSPVTLSISLNRRSAETNAVTSIDRPNLTLGPGATGTVNLLLSGKVPPAGIYEGLVQVSGAASPVVIPYLYIVGDGVPANLISLGGDGDEGVVGHDISEKYILLKVLDRYGVPVPSYPVRFRVSAGGGRLGNIDPRTDNYGLAGAEAVLGPNPGTNSYVASAGGLTTTFSSTARLQPMISAGGAVDAASFESGKAVAPGSYLAIYGNNLADTTQGQTTAYSPVSLSNVSVSFDAGGISAPGHVTLVSPGQVNVQVPWELKGQTSAQIKVNIGFSSGALYTLPLSDYAPALFEYQAGGQSFVAALDENYKVIGPGNPARQGHMIQLYCNGLGPVNNQPVSGDPAPSNPLAATVQTPVVTIGGLAAPVQFSGLAPGFAGLYQLNVMVPNAGAGSQAVAVSVNGQTGKQSLVQVQ